MRKLAALFTVALVSLSLVGCGKKEEKSGISITGPDGKETKIEVKTK